MLLTSGTLMRYLSLSIISGILLSSIIYLPSRLYAADLTGTDKDDTLYGTMADDTISGKKGMDSLYGSGGNDDIEGNSGNDYIQGEQGSDTLDGNDGNDVLIGNTGGDKINGGNGDDLLEANVIIGSTSVSDGSNDTLTCGPGNDTAFINPTDGDTASSDCELVISTP